MLSPGRDVFRAGVALSLLWFASLSSAQACLAVARDYVRVRSEQAVIIWDEAHQVEHFIRQADLATGEADIGFLVPTPVAPEIVEADPNIFKVAAEAGKPIGIPQTLTYQPLGAVLPIAALPLAAAHGGQLIEAGPLPVWEAAASPASIKQDNTGTFKATTFDASDTKGIQKWFQDRHYKWEEKDAAWLKSYAEIGWKVTALQLFAQKPAPEYGITSRAIRLSFPTAKPYYPYREPRAEVAPGSPIRRLNVAVLSDHRVEGKLEEGASWPAKLLSAGPAQSESQLTLINSSLITTAPSGWLRDANLKGSRFPTPDFHWLTYFRDESNPRPGNSDVIFTPNPDQAPFRATMVDYSLPPRDRINFGNIGSDLLAILLLLLLIVAPVYGGYRILAFRRKILRKESLAPSSRNRFLLDQVCAIGMLGGSFHGIFWTAMAVIALVGVFESPLSAPGAILGLILGFPFLILVSLIAVSVLYSASKLSRLHRPSIATLSPSPLMLRWDRLAGISALLVGPYFLIAYILYFSSFSW